MQRKLLGIAGIVLATAAVIYVARPAGHVPLFDANMVRLAETELEGRCAGVIFWRTQGAGDPDQAEDCRSQGGYRDVPAPAEAADAFCRAIVDEGWNGTAASCMEILRGQRLWPTLDGGITQEWNRARPWPLEMREVAPAAGDRSRTGVREVMNPPRPSRDDDPVPVPAPEETPESAEEEEEADEEE